MPHVDDINIRSNPEQRSQAIAACIQRVMESDPNIPQDQARDICIDQADKSMGTRESLANSRRQPNV